MKTLKLSLIAAAAILLASCGSKNEEKESADTVQMEEAYAGNETAAIAEESPAEETEEAEEAKSNSNIDKLLDDYEAYMDQTIKLAKKAQNGDMSAMTEYSSLLEKAEKLNSDIEKYEGDMTPAQAARFQKIAAKAASAMM